MGADSADHRVRRSVVAALLAALPLRAGAELTAATDADLADLYNAGARASGGRGASTMLRARAESGVERISGSSPLFRSGQILDTVRSADGSAVDITFSFPSEWNLASGPNLDVRNIRTSDSAYLLVTPLPKGKTFDQLPSAFFTDKIFASDGKYGAYGGVDGFTVKSFELAVVKTPSGSEQQYRQFELAFGALTYNGNVAQRRAIVSATPVGGSVFMLVAGCLSTRYKEASPDLAAIRKSFSAYTTTKARVQDLKEALAAETASSEDSMATDSRIGFRRE